MKYCTESSRARFLLPFVLTLLLLVFPSLDVRAQDDQPAKEDTGAQAEVKEKKFENVTWQEIVLVDFKPGKEGRAMEIIEEHFLATSEAAGTQKPIMVEMMSGEWDMMVIWTMKEGPASMEWEISPEGAKWRNAMQERVGGAERAEEIWNEYASLIQHSTSYIGMTGRHGASLASSE